MLEKEAEEYANKKAKELGINKLNLVYHATRIAYQKGAEFGYNKANEWHYVKDGVLPKEPRTVLVFTREFGVDMDIWTGKTFDQSVTDVIAWKEIVPPRR